MNWIIKNTSKVSGKVCRNAVWLKVISNYSNKRFLIYEKGRFSIPEEITFMGFNIDPGNQIMGLTLTSFDQSALDIGKKAAEMLLAQIIGFE